MIRKALAGLKLPVYGDGQQVRDWLHVDDHVRALWMIFERGRCGEKYNIFFWGGREEANLEVVQQILIEFGLGEELIEQVEDRPGHDLRYAINTNKIKTELGAAAKWTFKEGLKNTIQWYRDHPDYVTYQSDRLGL